MGGDCRCPMSSRPATRSASNSTDFIEFLADDHATSVLVVYTEQVRRPREFLDAIRRCRAAGKPVVLMFPGRSAKSKQAAQSHTGSLVGDYATMKTHGRERRRHRRHHMDEMMDLSEILVRFPKPPVKGPGVLTASGAFVGLSNDMAEDLGLDFPELTPATMKLLNEILPAYGNYGNPLDTTAGFTPESLPIVTKALIDDPNVGMLFISFPINMGATVQRFNKGMEGSDKPKVFVALGDNWQLGPDVMEAAAKPSGILAIFGPHVACHRALYTIRADAGPSYRPPRRSRSKACPSSPRERRRSGWARNCSPPPAFACPAGELARNVVEAATIATRIGYPVVLKAQAAALRTRLKPAGSC